MRRRAEVCNWPLGKRASACLALLALAASLTGCTESQSRLPRSARYAILRDLVLYQPNQSRGEPFFLDCFESTWSDWRAYVADAAAADDDRRALPGEVSGGEDHPVVNVSLNLARRFARWRFCRLPRLEEWRYAATGNGLYRYPWGDLFRPEWVNSWELGIGAATPVGTFESGRQEGGAYDLLGNVAEWTETVAGGWLQENSSPGRFGLADAVRTVARTPAMAWCLGCLPPPGASLLAAADASVPRVVVGGHYATALQRVQVALGPSTADPGAVPGQLERAPTEWGTYVGVRLAADPISLLTALREEPNRPAPAEAAVLTTFLRKHQQVLRPAWRRVRSSSDAGPLAATIARELR